MATIVRVGLRRTRPKPDPAIWVATLWLSRDQRDKLEGEVARIGRATDYEPSLSEMIRAAIDASLARLASESYVDLASTLEGKTPREAAAITERWLRERIGRAGK